mgnify:CR=1 FL=1
MNKIITIAFFMLLAWISVAQNRVTTLTASISSVLPTTSIVTADETNVLHTVTIALDADRNRIYFKTPNTITGVQITVRDRSNKIILQQHNMTIKEQYSISFPAPEKDNQYTVILQKDNHLLVERLPNEVF